MTVAHYNESWLEHILTQKFQKALGNGREFGGNIEKEFTLYKNNCLLNNKMNRDHLPNPLEEKEEKQGKTMGKNSFAFTTGPG